MSPWDQLKSWNGLICFSHFLTSAFIAVTFLKANIYTGDGTTCMYSGCARCGVKQSPHVALHYLSLQAVTLEGVSVDVNTSFYLKLTETPSLNQKTYRAETFGVFKWTRFKKSRSQISSKKSYYKLTNKPTSYKMNNSKIRYIPDVYAWLLKHWASSLDSKWSNPRWSHSVTKIYINICQETVRTKLKPSWHNRKGSDYNIFKTLWLAMRWWKNDERMTSFQLCTVVSLESWLQKRRVTIFGDWQEKTVTNLCSCSAFYHLFVQEKWIPLWKSVSNNLTVNFFFVILPTWQHVPLPDVQWQKWH